MERNLNSVYKKTVLDNGIRIVTEKIPYVRSISIGIWMTVGCRDEDSSDNGISHFIEHMLFKGTEKRNAYQIAESLESVGGHLNAFTGKELTCYYAHILDEHLPKAVDVLSDILIHSLLEEEEIQKEKMVILEEINNLEDTPEDVIHEHFQRALFPSHSLGYSTLGTRENVANFHRRDLVKLLNENYTTGRIIIAAAGNVNHDQLVGLIQKSFSEIPTNRDGRKIIAPCLPTQNETIIEDNCLQAHICLGTQAYSYSDPKKFGLLVLNTLLGTGMSSRLFQNIREKHGLAYSIYSFIDFLMDIGLFGIYLGTDKEKIEKSLKLIKIELNNLRENYVSEEELSRIRSQLKGNLMLGLESTSNRMNRLAKMEIYLGEYHTLDDTLQYIEKVTQKEMRDIANELFCEERLYSTVLKPKAKIRSGMGERD